VRAKNLELSREEAEELIRNAEYGVLATVSPDGQPGAVALNHLLVPASGAHPALQAGALYFHCGHDGEKLDNLRANPRVSFFVVGMAQVVWDQFREIYSSAVVQGSMDIVTNETERLEALKAIVHRFASHQVPLQVADEFTAQRLHTVEILRLTPTIITGKQRTGRLRPGLEY